MAAVDRSLVANLPMFAGLAPGEQDDLLREARSIRYTKGTAVFEQGFEADRFFVCTGISGSRRPRPKVNRRWSATCRRASCSALPRR